VAIVGPTGAGKTTLVNLLMRFYEIDAGTISVDGVDTRDLRRDDLRRVFGMVLQDTWLFNGTIRENIAYGREHATESEICAAADAAHVDHFVRTLPDGYETVLGDEAANISAGERQLLTIARAFLADPDVLILDEATSSVDTRTEVLIQQAMARLMEGRTSFVIAHRLSTIRNADTIVVMNEGRIVEQGSHLELMARQGFYYDLYNSQFADTDAETGSGRQPRAPAVATGETGRLPDAVPQERREAVPVATRSGGALLMTAGGHDSSRSPAHGSGRPVIVTQALTVYYGRHRGIDDLNMNVEQGEVYGFLGPNGAGKTTTLRVLLDIIRPTSGTATMFGLDCQKEGPAIRRRVGYLPGELSLYQQLRAEQYLRMLNAVRGQPADGTEIAGLCERLDLDPTRRMRTYSRGNKQKIGLVAAFMGRPELLLLDEPTSGLDPLVQQSVLDLVREARDDGRTVLMSSHVLSEVQSVCDRVGIIRDGSLAATQRLEDLIQEQLHRLTMRFERMPPDGAFDRDGTREIGRGDQTVTLEVRGDVGRLLSVAVQYGVVELETHQVNLEDVFMEYYGQRGGGDDA
jgi:ABC-type multidrug transport system fused ATPase/permease subunit